MSPPCAGLARTATSFREVSKIYKALFGVTKIKDGCRYEPVTVISNEFVQQMRFIDGEVLLSSEWRTIALLASLVEPNESGFYPVSMALSKWMKMLGLPVRGGRCMQHYLSQMTSLSKKHWYLASVSMERAMSPWINEPVYQPTKHILTLQLNPTLFPYFSPRVRPYTAVQPAMLNRLHSKYSCDLYIILKPALARGSYEIRVQDLLCRFGSLKLRSSHLDFRILKPCLREITDKTDLVVSHEIQRTSRRKAEVVAFTILRKGNLPPGKRLYNTAGPIVIPGMCEDKKMQLLLERLYRSYHERQTEAATSFPFAKFQPM